MPLKTFTSLWCSDQTLLLEGWAYTADGVSRSADYNAFIYGACGSEWVGADTISIWLHQSLLRMAQLPKVNPDGSRRLLPIAGLSFVAMRARVTDFTLLYAPESHMRLYTQGQTGKQFNLILYCAELHIGVGSMLQPCMTLRQL